jgi:hypothetical protein
MTYLTAPTAPLAVLGAARFEAGDEPRPPRVPNFVESEFNPLVDLVVGRVLADLDAGYQGSTGLVLISTYGDTTTADIAGRRVAAGKRQSAMLFFQSIPNSILGHLGVTYGFTGPLTCLSARTMLLSTALAAAELALEDGTDRVVLVGVDLAAAERVAATPGGQTAELSDTCTALVVQKAENVGGPALIVEAAAPGSAPAPAQAGGPSVGHRPMAALAALARQHSRGRLPEGFTFIDDADPDDGSSISYRVTRIGTQERGLR